MRAMIQRVREASVEIEGRINGKIGKGLLVLLGVEDVDTEEDAIWLCQKIVNMRIFNDAEGKMNESLLQVNGQLLVISQFTLFGTTKKGNRPGFSRAAAPAVATPLYEFALATLAALLGSPVASGIFGADMQVHLVNDGPVSIWMDTKNKE